MTKKIPTVFSLLLWAALWEIVSRIIQTDMLPPPTIILMTAVELVQLNSFQNAFLVTARAFLIGMTLALAVGIPAVVWQLTARICLNIFN